MLSFILMTSCQKVIEIEYPAVEPRLNVNCLFVPGEPFNVRIGQIRQLNDTLTPLIVEDAACIIREKDGQQEQLRYTENGFYVSEQLIPNPGKIYTLEVSHPDFETVTATDTMPQPVEPSEIYFTLNTLYDALDESFFHDLNLRFQDIPNYNNYYELRIVLEEVHDSDTTHTQILMSRTNDLSLQNTGLTDYEPASIPFSDNLFDGQNYFLSTYYRLPFSGSSGSGEVFYNDHNLIVHFNALSYVHYLYKRKMIMHLMNQESDIFEGVGDPIQMYSNIKNGYGIFAAYCPYIDTLHHQQ
jgi:hypothetical protein